MNKIAAFIIHLQRAAKRRKQVDTLINSLSIPGQILPACDGKELTDKQRAAYKPKLHKPKYPFKLSDGEVACFYSHRKAWQTIVDRDLDGALILEDDVALSDNFQEVLSKVMQFADTNDYIRLPKKDRKETGKEIYKKDDVSIIDPYMCGLNMQAQYVGKQAAINLLNASLKFDRPVDVFAQMRWLHSARMLSARPVVISEIDKELGGTVLQKKNMPLLEKLHHEINRPIARWSMRKYNKNWQNKI